MRRITLALLTLSLLAGCGGGGGGDEDVETVEELILGDPDLDGFSLNRQGTIIGNAAAGPAAGDLPHPDGQQTYRAIFSFDLDALPAGATVVSAEFTVRQIFASGDPIGLMGSLIADHIAMGTPFDQAVFDQFTLETIRDGGGVPVVLSDSAAQGPRTMDVTAQVRNDIGAGRPRSQFRVRGAVDVPDGDEVTDLINFSDGEGSPASAPTLRVVYVAP